MSGTQTSIAYMSHGTLRAAAGMDGTCSYFNETGLEGVSLVKEKTATTNQAVIVILFIWFSAIDRHWS